jgi:UPF0716 protein FxsA
VPPTSQERAIPLLILILLPLIEIVGFVLVGRAVGVLATLGLVLLSSFVGILVLRHHSFSLIGRVQREMKAGHDPGRELADGVMVLFAGILFLIPGFFTDIVAILLMLAPVRAWMWRLAGKKFTGRVQTFGFGRAGAPRRDHTIDLDEEDYSRGPTREPHDTRTRAPTREPGERSPWKRLGDK